MLGLRRAAGELLVGPPAAAALAAGDTIIVTGAADAIDALPAEPVAG